ncbi:MAG: ShlB/FhaC/HecB family hemolysin secretion/activation protein [Alphaproteobacteria bacterium]|nr:hypothetical protein [Alphaproteobacteria bacterium]MDE2336990.1 ShlB/FhaC/HecB family hemolysin secretion/activation protein [Alphaproteobacteria bacterium]
MGAALFSLPVAARAVVTPPSSTEPGIVMRGLTQEGASSGSGHQAVIVIPTPTQPGAQEASTEKIFILKAVVLDAPNVYNPMPLYDMWSDMVGKKVSLADLNTIAARVTKKYRDDGYIFSRAIVPPQKIVGGVVHLQAVEGRIARVLLTGHYKDKSGLIRAFADRIDTRGPANTHNIERYLLLINDLPGITAKSVIRPAKEANGADLIIDIEEKRAEGSLSFDNRGSKYLGPYRGTAVAAFNDALGLHDRTTFRGILSTDTKELRFGDITHEEQIGDDGAKVKVRAAFTHAQPGGNVSSDNILGDSQMYDLEGDYPVVRSRQYNWNLIAGFNYLDSTTDVSGTQTADDHVRTARAGTHFDMTDALAGVSQIDLTATQGLNVLGATPDGTGRSRANGHEEFLKGNITVTRIQKLPGLWSLMLSGAGQLADHPLLASEEFIVGGPTYGRAYDDGEISGDNGYAGVTELRYGGSVEDSPILNSYQAYTFIDYGKVKNYEPAVGETKQDSLTSTGLGVRFNLAYALSGDVELDKPLNKLVQSQGNRDSRLFFSLLKRF